MSILMAVLLAFPLAPDDEHELELAVELARKGWIDMAEEICERIEKNPRASAAAKSGVPLALAEVAVARARRETDVLRAAKELDLAVERLRGAKRAPTLDERGMTGYLHVQKAKLLSAAAEEDAGRRPDALQAWGSAEGFYRSSLAELDKMAASGAVEEAILDARLEIPKAMAAQARVPSIDPGRRKKLLEESIRLLADFQFGTSLQPVLLEAQLEEGRCRADLQDYVRAERCFRGLPRLAQDLRKNGYPASDYATAQLHGGVLSLARTLIQARKPKEASAACDEFLRDNPKLEAAPIGHALVLAKADALHELKDEAGAIALAEKVAARNPDGAAGRMALDMIKKWIAAGHATPERVLKVADYLVDRGRHREALVELRRCADVCATPADRARFEPVASFKRGECFRALKQDLEASLAWQDVFRRYPAHELAPRAAFEAVRSSSRVSAASGDRRDEDQMVKLLDEVERLGLQASFAGYLKFIRAEILERKGQLKAAADLFKDVDEACEVFVEAMISAGHNYRVDAEQRWERERGSPAAAREAIVAQLGAAEAALRRALRRLEGGGRERARQLAVACYELAAASLHELSLRPKEALDLLRRCAALLPPQSEMFPRLSEMEIQAHLAAKDVDAAAAGLEKMLAGFPDSPSTARSCRRVALRFEGTEPARSLKYYRTWLDRSSTTATSTADVRSVADGLYRIARALNGLDEKVVSILGLQGKPVVDRGAWREAARAHELLIRSGGLAEKDAVVAATRLVWCTGFMADSAADWAKSKALCEKLLDENQFLLKDGTINRAVLEAQPWLAGIYFEVGHALVQLGRTGQKFQFGNAIRVFNNLLTVSQGGSEPWWIARYMSARCLFERGEGSDIRDAGALLSLLEGDRSGFDGGKYGMKARFVELRDQVRAALGPQR